MYTCVIYFSDVSNWIVGVYMSRTIHMSPRMFMQMMIMYDINALSILFKMISSRVYLS